MGWLSDISTRSKLLLGFGTLVVLLAVVAALGTSTVFAIQAGQRVIVEQELAPVSALLQARGHINHVRGDILDLMITTNQADWPAIEADLAAIEAQALERLTSAQAMLRVS